MLSLLPRYFAPLIVVLLFADQVAVAQKELEVITNLKSYDSIYGSGFSVSGTRKSQDHLILGRLLVNVERKWKLSFDGSRCGYLMEVVDYEKPKFVEPTTGGLGPRTDENGALLVSVRTKEWGYWGVDVSGTHYEDMTIRITPQNEVIEEPRKMQNSLLFGPRDAGPNAPKRAILWSLGRFFSENISEVTLAKQSIGGRITVSALGRKGAGRPGRWELEIEPAAAWMVREARFYSHDRPDAIGCEMKNSGTVWTGAYCVPENAKFNYGGSIENPGAKGDVEEITFNSVIEQFDEALYVAAQQAVTKDRPSNLTVHDLRMDPPLIFQPKEDMANLLSQEGDFALDMTLTKETPPDASNTPEPVRQIPTESAEQSVPNPVRPSYLLSTTWTVIVMLLAVVCAVCGFIFLRKSGKG